MAGHLNIIHPRIEKYLLEVTPPRDPVITEMEALAEERRFPIVGPLVGRLLELLARSADARRVLELGSGFGYSALWFARGVGPGGEVVATERSRENVGLGERFIARASFSDRVRFHLGDALQIARNLEGPFDIVFNDVDKSEYPRALGVATRLLGRGGLFISDNMLWRGNVVDSPGDAATSGVQELTRQLYASQDFLTSLIPLRDGVTVSVRLR